MALTTNLGFVPSWQFSTHAGPLAGSSLGFVPEWQFSTHAGPLAGLGQLSAEPIDTLNTVFDSFWWRNRKWLAFAAVAALGLGIFGGLTAIAK